MAVSESLSVSCVPASTGTLRDALEGDVDKALLHVIDGGLIEPDLLNAALVPEALFVRAKKAGIR